MVRGVRRGVKVWFPAVYRPGAGLDRIDGWKEDLSAPQSNECMNAVQTKRDDTTEGGMD